MIDPIKELTVAHLFNFIAPVAIYHGADLTFEKEAKWALKKMDFYCRHENRSVQTRFLKWVKVAASQHELRFDELLQFRETDQFRDVVDVYNELFEEVVMETQPDWERFRDRYGALGFRDSNGHYVFSGDQVGVFPWYQTAELLLKRLQQHEQESAINPS